MYSPPVIYFIRKISCCLLLHSIPRVSVAHSTKKSLVSSYAEFGDIYTFLSQESNHSVKERITGAAGQNYTYYVLSTTYYLRQGALIRFVTD